MIQSHSVGATLNGRGYVTGGVGYTQHISATPNNGVIKIVTNDYNEVNNKPLINGVELVGDLSLEELGIKQEYTANDITFEDGTTFQ